MPERHLRIVPNEPVKTVPYDVENDSAPMDETWVCPLCGHSQPMWFGLNPTRCRSCGQRPNGGTQA